MSNPTHTSPALTTARRFTGAALIAATLATGGLGYVLTHDGASGSTVASASSSTGTSGSSTSTTSNTSTTSTGSVTTTTQAAQTTTKGS